MDRNRKIEVMGIVNLTDDSFYSGNRFLGKDVHGQIEKMLAEGADIIDLGACSTRPGSQSVSLSEEWARLEPVLRMIASDFPDLRVSIDTFRSDIVRRALDLIGPFIVNDISSGEDDPIMLDTVAESNLEYIAMHKRGTPGTMQNLCDYGKDGVVAAVRSYFEEFGKNAREHGINRWILDPGFGFAKTAAQNFELLEGLNELRQESVPILAGVSRKSFIYKPLGLTPETCGAETQAVHMRCLELGADILRVHDVADTVKTIKIYQKNHPVIVT